MRITSSQESPVEIAADAVVVGVYKDGVLPEATATVDKASGGVITRLIEAKEITGGDLELTTLLAPAGVTAGQVVIVGLGDADHAESQGRGKLYRAAGSAARHLASKVRGRVAFYLPAADSESIAAGICGAIAGCQGQDLYRAEKKRHPFEEIVWNTDDATAIQAGEVLGNAVNLTRHLVNEPAAEIYPESFAERAQQVATECGLECEVWDQAKLEAEKCGSLLGVARGSDRPPRLVILRHRGGGAEGKQLALVGKGVTFDSGGLSLKPNDSMKTMKCDMAGAATVLGAMQAIAEMKLPVNVVGLVGLVENMVSGDSYKLGDVLTTRNGKTIEVLNTDAEGRLVLADVLDVAVSSEGADSIIDLATLTGACVVALGLDVAGLMTNDQAWCDSVSAAAGTCGERVWQLPMFPEFGEQIKSEIADIKNIGEGRWGGAITAAKLLEEFVDGRPWVHIDIAGPAFLDSPKPWLDGGGSGALVRTLVEVAKNWQR